MKTPGEVGEAVSAGRSGGEERARGERGASISVGAGTKTSTTTRRAHGSWWLYAVFGVVAGVVAASISWGFLSASLAALGIPDPGPLTTAGLPFVRAAAWIAASVAAGSFLAAGFLISPRVGDGSEVSLRDAPLTVDGHVAGRTGAWASLVLAGCATVLIPLTLSDVSGTPLSGTLQPSAWALALDQVPAALAWMWVAMIAAVTGVGGLVSRRGAGQPVLLLGSLLAVVPLGMQGHSAAGGDHDYGTNSYLWHVIFLVLWIGGLIALIAHCRRLGPGMAVAVRRYSALALVCVVVMAASGLINAVIRIEWQDWLTTTYGRIIVAKTVGVVGLALLGFVHRQWTIPQLEREPGNPRPFYRVAVVEVLVMAAVTGVAITMGRTPPPPPRDPNLSAMAIKIGFDLHQPPTFWNVWTMWRFDILFSSLAVIMAACYLRGVLRLRARGQRWPWVRTAWFMAGCISLGLMMSSGMGMNMMALFSMHMVVHMGLTMVIPVFLVLGNPLTLIMEATEPGPPGQPGLREWTQALCQSRIIGVLTHPGVNTVQFVTIFYLLYLTPFYPMLVSEHGGHVGMNVLFLLSGYIYFWDMIGSDPVPNRRKPTVRLWWLLLSMPFHLYFGVYLMQLTTVIAQDFYQSLLLPWDPDLLADQRVGGGIAWASGGFPLLVVFGVLFYQWRQDDQRTERAYDKQAEDDGDAEMEAYNQMLARMSSGQESAAPYYSADYYTREFGEDGSVDK
ncbi:cytochrome c oxidase assembly protein [Corynebacterium sp. Marseille-Q2516]